MRLIAQTLLVATHDLVSISKFCDRSIFFNQTILAAGTTKKTLTAENLWQFADY